MNEQEAKKVNQHPKPFPWKCSACGKEEVRPATIDYTAKVKHHGKKYSVEVPALPVLKCGHCEEVLFTNSSQAEIDRAFRVKLGRLLPEEIREQRLALGWTQKQLAAYTGAAEATVSRWESGLVIQSKRADRDLRACFDKSLQEAAAEATARVDSSSPGSHEAGEALHRCICQYAMKCGKMAPEQSDRPVGPGERKLLRELLDLLADLYASDRKRGLEDAVRHLKLVRSVSALPDAIVGTVNPEIHPKRSASSFPYLGGNVARIAICGRVHEASHSAFSQHGILPEPAQHEDEWLRHFKAATEPASASAHGKGVLYIKGVKGHKIALKNDSKSGGYLGAVGSSVQAKRRGKI